MGNQPRLATPDARRRALRRNPGPAVANPRIRMKTSRAGGDNSFRRGGPRTRKAGIWGLRPAAHRLPLEGRNSRVPVGGARASRLGRDVVAVVALGLLQEAALEDLALGLAGEAIFGPWSSALRCRLRSLRWVIVGAP